MSYSSELKQHLQTLGFKKECCMLACSAGYEGEEFERGCDRCLGCFLRGVFFRYGYLTPPEKDALLTFDFYDDYAFYVQNVLQEVGFDAKVTERRGKKLIYLKKSEAVSDIVSLMGAVKYSLKIMEVQVDKQCRNELNRMVNAETANLNRTAGASAKQLAAIHKLKEDKKFGALPIELQTAAEMRLAHPEANLEELRTYFDPPISKSGLNHRLRKIIDLADLD
ncbi:MAG: DNA-binding protein WhiA [Clostridia bacterium]|nr:DNA-binding protein WhiA [Clostridia bacterium]